MWLHVSACIRGFIAPKFLEIVYVFEKAAKANIDEWGIINAMVVVPVALDTI